MLFCVELLPLLLLLSENLTRKIHNTILVQRARAKTRRVGKKAILLNVFYVVVVVFFVRAAGKVRKWTLHKHAHVHGVIVH